MNKILFFILILLSPCVSVASGEERNWEKEDEIALSITVAEARSVATLIDKIKSAKTDEWGKFRIAFRWVAEHIVYDVVSLRSGNIKACTPDETLKKKKAVCQGYADLLKAISDGLGIKCEVVSGYSKGGDYKPGDHFTKTDHAWNAAQFDGKWFLFDATWAAGYLNAKDGHYYKRFESFYFAPNPEEFVFGHLPKDPQWQIMPDTISLAEFEKRMDVGVALFRMGMKVETLRSICPSLLQCDLVSVNPTLGSVIIEKAAIPFERTLRNGETYTFAITSPKGSEFFIFNEKSQGNLQPKGGVIMWDDDLMSSMMNTPTPVAMNYKKGIYSTTVTAKSGDLAIYIKDKGKKKYLFTWKVK